MLCMPERLKRGLREHGVVVGVSRVRHIKTSRDMLQARSSGPPRTPGIHYRWRRTCWARTLRPGSRTGIRWGVFIAVDDLIAGIVDYLAVWNQNPSPSSGRQA